MCVSLLRHEFRNRESPDVPREPNYDNQALSHHVTGLLFKPQPKRPWFQNRPVGYSPLYPAIWATCTFCRKEQWPLLATAISDLGAKSGGKLSHRWSSKWSWEKWPRSWKKRQKLLAAFDRGGGLVVSTVGYGHRCPGFDSCYCQYFSWGPTIWVCTFASAPQKIIKVSWKCLSSAPLGNNRLAYCGDKKLSVGTRLASRLSFL